MSDILPTVVIKTVNGPVVINLSDYDPKIHELVEGDAPAVEGDAPAAEGDLENMTATELKALAEERKVDVRGLRSKADLLKALQDAEAAPQFFVYPTAEGKFMIVDVNGDRQGEEEFETQEEAEQFLAGE